MSEIRGSSVLITGGASGIGRLMALEMAHQGADLVLWDLNGDALDTTAREVEAATGRRARTYVCDVSRRDDVYATAARTLQDAGRVDILINNAGVVSGRSLLELSDEKIETTFAVNTLALFWTTKAFLPSMIERGRGHLVTIASASSLIGVNRLSDYAASKWAAMGFDESLRVEMRRTAPYIRTTVVCPFYINTGMFAGVRSRWPLFLPLLEPQAVARRIVRAIRKDHARLIMPWSVALIPLMRMLPPSLMDPIADHLGVNSSMDEFTGRADPAATRGA
ncbi:MAG TPA: SDR family oxidoreductase [Candidatus Limnocylindrales bacterium]|nr:SDR family oxidoreductase [Candidatus Limnocylindrales bacterium]